MGGYVAKYLRRLVEYQIFYTKGASIHHTSSYKGHFYFREGEFHVHPIRHLRYATELVNFTGQLALGSYATFLRYYRPRELNAFGAIYVREWKEAYMEVARLSYDDNPQMSRV